MSDKLLPFEEASKKIKEIIVEVIKLENVKLSQKEPRIGGEVMDIVKSLVTEKDLNQDDIIDNEEEVW